MTKPLKVAVDGIVRKAAWLHIVNRHVLFVRSRGVTLAYTIGGKIELGETAEEALIREVAEEIGVRLIPATVKFHFLFVGPCDGYVEGTKLHMYTFTARHEGIPVPKAEIEELAYLTSADIGKKRTTLVGEQILDHLAYAGQIE